ncbi:hypothetical protein ZRA01_18480 [Zoogloea ramigera]|uniref:Uncharacterized protein n=1 Tax=Zoogloea ramigera TaxID=350 RepID=A0A4Y4CS55_ZOORA|nr:hypothetical protein ZRA01_18480 [Zoogloea ramigera]
MEVGEELFGSEGQDVADAELGVLGSEHGFRPEWHGKPFPVLRKAFEKVGHRPDGVALVFQR